MEAAFDAIDADLATRLASTRSIQLGVEGVDGLPDTGVQFVHRAIVTVSRRSRCPRRQRRSALVGGVALVTSPSLADVETGRTGRLVLPSIVPTFDYDPEAQLRDTLAADVAVARTTLSALDATKRLIAERRLSRRQALLDAPGVAARRAAEAERRAAEMAAHMQQPRRLRR